MLHVFSNKFSIMILLGMNLLGCAGSTTVQRQHHLLLENSSTVSVCFLRPKEGFMGVRGKPIGIHLDSEHLLDLSIGEYTFLDLQQGEYDMVVTSSTIEGPNNAMVETSRDFVLDLADADSVYLLFTLEQSNFWEMVNQNLADQVDASTGKLISQLDTITVRFGKHVVMRFGTPATPQPSYHPGIGYKVESVSRQAAIEMASKLEPVEGAQNSPLHK